MQHLNVRRTALSLGLFVGFLHLVWSIIVALGWAKPISDFILGLHHIQLSYTIAPFSLGTAIALILVTFISGYVFGLIFAVGWNMCKKH
ncbi:MAG: hypothetical protein A3C79_02640 [Candidatus Taylorbacteria bacterium RIFCSPHIGHO2_02_FULL_45_28]|uniref:DUF2062 domain-containing protein n=1 Tax=Candidatus Taylorbacteria bacterium RIFCSPHIGHO2_12_FULL_45_16 TaxID=1802315 RepID=A0A1G2MY21_9BACT|nr:MAG: hypothetical protein A2830_03445 [Candidatus Taylorbacteria bacterium RIFCSPHIGHO2_01_FULL_44_110]OHA25347.1 MAG: hypothetical protein A3C79_02640 [Candidatus Taylorbacteria bacterium RIFCSPHIGHO2_02_FULL_45_28]OHA28734.1 MAG: hypothetical protein A3F51_03105 [Candidatus Taylorbacteria bacterium RIFCSPHIGHO2_12_FULL_45_16]OHA33007.1 MAG: hypothetical protein A3A23_01285 [Candidatus Taylorbacteria bacterium RIFCSPLOWO2_01_FULL_45_59]OHA39676.1 MAG: hypothetical protein A3I98_01005 [Candi